MEKPFERLRQARIAAGFKSASAAARQFGWGDATYRHHENGTRGYGYEQAAQYSSAFGVSTWWLLDLGVGSSESWRVPLGRFYTSALLSELSYRPGVEEILDIAEGNVNLSYVPELLVNQSTIEIARDEKGDAKFHFISADSCGLDASLFKSGRMFVFRVDALSAGAAARPEDVLLVDSDEASVGTKPEMWLIRLADRAAVRWAVLQDDGSIILQSDSRVSTPDVLESRDAIVGKVVWLSRKF